MSSLQNPMQAFDGLPIRQAVFRQIFPAVASQMITLIYNLADTYFVGLLNQPSQTAAITVVYSPFLMLTAISNLFGVGGASALARALGHKAPDKAREIAAISFWWGAAASLVFCALFWVFAAPILSLCGATADTLPIALGYAKWAVVIGGPATILNTLLANLIRAEGKAGQASFGVSMGGIANLVPFEKKLGLLTLPYLFANIDEVVAGTNGAPAELLNKYATKAGFRILTWTYTDFRYISNSKRPITKMADMQGLKFRVPQSAVLIAAYKAFGGSPTPISWAETFTALQQGVVDGQCYGYIGFKAMKFNEANQKYLTEVHYTYQLQPLVISERVFKKMTPEMQKVIVDAGKYAQDAVLKFQLENAEAAKKELIAGGLVVSQLEDEDLWKKAAIEKVWPEMADFVGGKDAINEYLKACGKDAWK